MMRRKSGCGRTTCGASSHRRRSAAQRCARTLTWPSTRPRSDTSSTPLSRVAGAVRDMSRNRNRSVPVLQQRIQAIKHLVCLFGASNDDSHSIRALRFTVGAQKFTLSIKSQAPRCVRWCLVMQTSTYARVCALTSSASINMPSTHSKQLRGGVKSVAACRARNKKRNKRTPSRVGLGARDWRRCRARRRRRRRERRRRRRVRAQRRRSAARLNAGRGRVKRARARVARGGARAPSRLWRHASTSPASTAARDARSMSSMIAARKERERQSASAERAAVCARDHRALSRSRCASRHLERHAAQRIGVVRSTKRRVTQARRDGVLGGVGAQRRVAPALWHVSPCEADLVGARACASALRAAARRRRPLR